MITEYSESYSSKALFKFFIGLSILAAIIIYNIGFETTSTLKTKKQQLVLLLTV
jgi:hypothetical protein